MECGNSNDGSLLIQYTLNLLDEEDRYRFEVHMMSCEFCRLELSKGDPETAFIGVRKEHIVEALHEEGISFERLKEELTAAKRKKRVFQSFLGDLSEKIAWLFRPRVLVPAGVIAVVLLIVMLPKHSEPDNVYLSMLSFDKFAYQELSTRAMGSTFSMSPLFTVGMKAYSENDYGNAAKILKEATQESPEKWDYWFYLGVSYYLDKQAEPAIAALLEADKLNQYALEIEIKWFLAQSYLLIKDSNSALVHLRWLEDKPGEYSSRAISLVKAIQEVNAGSE